MGEKRKNDGDLKRESKRLKTQANQCNNLESLPLEIAEKVYQNLRANDLKNLLLVSNTTLNQVKSCSKLMEKFVLDLGKTEISSSTRSHRHLRLVKFNPRVKGTNGKIREQKILKKLSHFGPNAVTLLLVDVEFPTLRFMRGFDLSISSLSNLRELELIRICLDGNSKMAEGEWTLNSLEILRIFCCDSEILKKFKSITSLKKFEFCIDPSQGFFEEQSEFKLVQDFIENQTRLEELNFDMDFHETSCTFTLRESKSSLKKFSFCNNWPDNVINIQNYIKSNSSSLNSVELKGRFKPELIESIFNGLKVLKHLRVEIEIDGDLDEVEPPDWNSLSPNNTVEHLEITEIFDFDIFRSFLNDHHNGSSFIHLFPNVRKLRTSNFTDNECWQLIHKHMKKLESIQLSCDASHLKNIKFTAVTKIVYKFDISKMCDQDWAQLAESFPNVEEFTMMRRYPFTEAQSVETVRETFGKLCKKLKIFKSI